MEAGWRVKFTVDYPTSRLLAPINISLYLGSSASAIETENSAGIATCAEL